MFMRHVFMQNTIIVLKNIYNIIILVDTFFKNNFDISLLYYATLVHINYTLKTHGTTFKLLYKCTEIVYVLGV